MQLSKICPNHQTTSNNQTTSLETSTWGRLTVTPTAEAHPLVRKSRMISAHHHPETKTDVQTDQTAEGVQDQAPAPNLHAEEPAMVESLMELMTRHSLRSMWLDCQDAQMRTT